MSDELTVDRLYSVMVLAITNLLLLVYVPVSFSVRMTSSI